MRRPMRNESFCQFAAEEDVVDGIHEGGDVGVELIERDVHLEDEFAWHDLLLGFWLVLEGPVCMEVAVSLDHLSVWL